MPQQLFLSDEDVGGPAGMPGAASPAAPSRFAAARDFFARSRSPTRQPKLAPTPEESTPPTLHAAVLAERLSRLEEAQAATPSRPASPPAVEHAHRPPKQPAPERSDCVLDMGASLPPSLQPTFKAVLDWCARPLRAPVVAAASS